jgi:hypothetical protein
MDNGSNDWDVSYAAITFLEQALGTHAKVASFTRTCDIVFDITRIGRMTPVTAVLVNRYTLGLADLMRARGEFPQMNCLVTSGNWNRYTEEAKEYGKQIGVCVFNISEFFGALRWKEMINYVAPEESDKKHGGRRRYS